MRSLYIDCSNGISGDMFVGALLSLGANFEYLVKELRKLDIYGYHLEYNNSSKNNIVMTDFRVILHENVTVPPVNLMNVIDIIENSELLPEVKKISIKIFTIAAEAGAEAHRAKSIDEFYFHEKGALDSFADIVGAAICLADLEAKNIYVSTINDGHGFITYSKGRLPVPVPAVKNIVKAYQLDLVSTDIVGELVTPTGAAIIAGLNAQKGMPEAHRIIKSGIGIGKRKYNPNALLYIHEIESKAYDGRVV